MAKTEMQSIIRHLNNTLDGEPWFGRPVFRLLGEIDSTIAYRKLTPSAHSPIELLYHMLTWADFTLKRIQKDKINDLEAFEKLDWREIDPKIHDWDEGLGALIATHQEISALLQQKDDSFLEEKVDYREYDFRVLLNGLIEHNIYHAGQVALLKKMMS
ncbi:MAG: DinB family protein [Chitinophagaceae bacterium]|nr:MAG: DinB family protein [Chitinophagaceae bacterium]